MKPDRNAIVIITEPDDPAVMVRPALFVYPTPDGFAWVEPSYLEPIPTGTPAFHRAYGQLELGPGQVAVVADDGRRYTAVAFAGDNLEADTDGSIAAMLVWAQKTIEGQGTTVALERERLKAVLGEQLA